MSATLLQCEYEQCRLSSFLSHYSEGALKSTVAISRENEIPGNPTSVHRDRVSFHVVGNSIASHSYHRHKGFSFSEFNSVLAI